VTIYDHGFERVHSIPYKKIKQSLGYQNYTYLVWGVYCRAEPLLHTASVNKVYGMCLEICRFILLLHKNTGG